MTDNNNSNAPPQRQSRYSQFEIMFLYLLLFLALPAELLLRKKFGKRHLRLFHASFTSVSIYLFWIGTIALIPFLLHQKETVLTWFYLLTACIMATYHAIEIALRRRKRVIIHSYYTGYSRILPYISSLIPELAKTELRKWGFTLEIFVKMYIEPLICIVVGFLAMKIEPLLGMLIILSGIGMYVWGAYKKSHDDDRESDLIDGQIEAGELQNSLRENEISNFGYESYAPRAKVVSSRPNPTPKREADEEELSQLTPELKRLLNEEEKLGEELEQTQARSSATVKIKVSSSREGEHTAVSGRSRGRPRRTETSSVLP
jgi:hypothetical protein